MTISLIDLMDEVKQLAPELQVTLIRGAQQSVSQFAPLPIAKAGDIAFLTNSHLSKHSKQALELSQCHASALVLTPSLWELESSALDHAGIIICDLPYVFFAFAAQRLQMRANEQTKLLAAEQINKSVSLKAQTTDSETVDSRSTINPSAVIHPTAAIHPSAVIHHSATVGAGVKVGAFAHIAENAVIEEQCDIDNHVSIGPDAYIAQHTHLYSHVTIYHGVHIGQRCIIHSGTVIGSDGFGFAPYQKRWIKIPQIGTVRIGNDVEIGSNCAIDRGALGDTVIGRGTKLDNLIQIAHNVQVGEDCAFAANIAIAGSAIIGNRVQMGGKAGVLGHLSVCDDVVISSCTLVTKTILKPGFYTGVYPMQENAEWEKNAVSLKRLNALREQVKVLEKTLAPS